MTSRCPAGPSRSVQGTPDPTRELGLHRGDGATRRRGRGSERAQRKGPGQRASPGRVAWARLAPAQMGGCGLTEAEQRGTEPHSEAGPWKKAAGLGIPGHREWPEGGGTGAERHQLPRRTKGLPSVPPETWRPAGPGHLHLRAPRSAAALPPQGGLTCPARPRPCPARPSPAPPSPAPPGPASPGVTGPMVGKAGLAEQRPVAVTLEQKPAWEVEGALVPHGPRSPPLGCTPHPGLL